MICKAVKCDAGPLTELTIPSKSHWDYEKKQIEKWIDELTITEKYIQENHIYKLIDYEELIGFYAYTPKNATDIQLNYLFVDAKFMGLGYVKLLILDFIEQIEVSRFTRAVLDVAPHVEKFYPRLGFQIIGKLESSIKNRFVPIMAKNIGIPN